MSGFGDFFLGDAGNKSMPRLLSFLAYFPASIVLFTIKDDDAKANALIAYLGAFVLQYIGGKVSDIFMKEKPNVTETTTRITTPSVADNATVAKDVNIKAEGDIHVSPVS